MTGKEIDVYLETADPDDLFPGTGFTNREAAVWREYAREMRERALDELGYTEQDLNAMRRWAQKERAAGRLRDRGALIRQYMGDPEELTNVRRWLARKRGNANPGRDIFGNRTRPGIWGNPATRSALNTATRTNAEPVKWTPERRVWG